MSAPDRRRILVKGPTAAIMGDRVRGYGALYPGGPGAYAIRITEPVGGWAQVEVPADLPLVHFHNLAKWFEGDAAETGAEDVVTLSHGQPPWEYWLVPCKDSRTDWFLSGANGEGRTFQWDCTRRCAVDDPGLQRSPMGSRLAMMTRGVPAGLHPADASPPRVEEIVLHLDDPEPHELVMPEPGSLADSFERTPDPRGDPGGFEQVLEWVGGLFAPRK